MRVAVLGQIARDLVLVVPEVPDAAGTAPVLERREVLGGKGANIAVGLAQLGASTTLLGVVGEDDVGNGLVDRLRADGVDTSAIVRRGRSALIVDVVCGGKWRYLQDLPESSLVHEADVMTSAVVGADAVIVQLQQPVDAALAAIRLADGLVVLDGVATGEQLAGADVLRADHQEGEELTGRCISSTGDAVLAGRELLGRGPSLVALEVRGVANVLVWSAGSEVVPLTDEDVVDTTGGGDAFVAALTFALVRGDHPREAGRLAVAAAGRAVGHAGGRSDLTGLRV
ncbi:PfkB family carbohydrate kinase [Saccharothrix australiensis]|uniref:Ribokinase n=1 Tax=Saccharothrix australiensis TaxID=2072 RepID=A0A495VXU0_9PSEU|nr:PfkB family carbohydrate kinase [Saccharothrix australiensis]RKT54069.1 ribokinase [Saccharothrix australiensis]